MPVRAHTDRREANRLPRENAARYQITEAQAGPGRASTHAPQQRTGSGTATHSLLSTNSWSTAPCASWAHLHLCRPALTHCHMNSAAVHDATPTNCVLGGKRPSPEDKRLRVGGHPKHILQHLHEVDHAVRGAHVQRRAVAVLGVVHRDGQLVARAALLRHRRIDHAAVPDVGLANHLQIM
jgi:hypothetical protein